LRPNAWVGLSAIIFGIAYGVQAFGLPRAPIGNPLAPVFFPLGLAGLMVIFGAAIFIIEAKKGLNSDDKGKRPKFGFQTMKLIWVAIVLCLLYSVIFNYLGFVISTVIFLMLLLTAINGAEKTVSNAVISLVYSFGMWYVFVKIFQISLPNSPLGIF
jgi:putative tricarboxylic transport membrane protein